METVEPVTIFLSGLGGAVVGSLITLAGAFSIERRRVRHERKAAARALYFEAATNATYLGGMADATLPFIDPVDATWRVVQPAIAGRVALHGHPGGHDEHRDSATARGLRRQRPVDLGRKRGRFRCRGRGPRKVRMVRVR